MLSLQTSNDDLCWLVGLCPRSRTASSIQGQSVLGWDGGSPAAPAVRLCRGLLLRCRTLGNKGDRWPAKDSDMSHVATWDHPSCCSVVLVSRTNGLKGELHSTALQPRAIFFTLFEVAQLLLSQKNCTCLSHVGS